MATKKEVAVKEETAMMMTDTRPDFMADGNRGNESVGFDDMTIPRVDVIQDLSPQHKKNKPEYIEGAEPGMLFNTVTGELYGDGVVFVPVYFRKEWVVWKDQNKGGGFRGAFDSQLEAEQYISTQDDASDLEAVDTAQHFGLIVGDGGHVEEVVISMSKSKMKVSRKFNSMVKMAGGDRFSRAYKISAISDQNAAGQDYWNLAVKQLGYVSETIYRKGEKMYADVTNGVLKINRAADAEKEVEAEREY